MSDALDDCRERLAQMRDAADTLRSNNDGWTDRLAEEVHAFLRSADNVAGMEPERDRLAALHAIRLGELLARAGREMARYVDAQVAVPRA